LSESNIQKLELGSIFSGSTSSSAIHKSLKPSQAEFFRPFEALI